MKKVILLTIYVIAGLLPIQAQNEENKIILDEIIATVGSRIITTSDLEYAVQAQKYQMGIRTMEIDEENQLRCLIFEKVVLQKLLIAQAELDSVVLTDAQVNERLEYNIRMQLARMGNDPKKLEEYYGKSIAEIKADSREQLKDEMLADETQKNLTSKISVIYQEVKEFYESIPPDSLPIVEVEYEIAQIVQTPAVSDEAKIAAKTRLEEFRERALKGENFSTFARMYSEDHASAAHGGDIGFTNRGDLYPEFENVAYNLKPGEISPVVETKAGYHIIKMIERRGDRINVSHILIKPKPSPEEMVKSKEYLDSIYNILQTTSLPFDTAARRYSDDPSKINHGMIVNPYTASYAFAPSHLQEYDKSIYYMISSMSIGTYSRPLPMITEDGNQAYRIIYLKSIRPEHALSLTLDYEKIKNAALENKKEETLTKWAKNKVKYTHVKINSKYHACPFVEEWGIHINK